MDTALMKRTNDKGKVVEFKKGWTSRISEQLDRWKLNRAIAQILNTAQAYADNGVASGSRVYGKLHDTALDLVDNFCYDHAVSKEDTILYMPELLKLKALAENRPTDDFAPWRIIVGSVIGVTAMTILCALESGVYNFIHHLVAR